MFCVPNLWQQNTCIVLRFAASISATFQQNTQFRDRFLGPSDEDCIKHALQGVQHKLDSLDLVNFNRIASSDDDDTQTPILTTVPGWKSEAYLAKKYSSWLHET